MASISVINAESTNKSNRNENESVEITVRIGVFFDGTNNNRAQVMLGRMNKEEKINGLFKLLEEDKEAFEKIKGDKYYKKLIKYYKKLKKEDDEIISTMELDKLSEEDRSYIENANDKAEAKRKILKKQSKRFLGIGMPRDFGTHMQSIGFTNIAILERFYQPAEQSDYTYKIYVTGSGTHAKVSKGIDITGLAAGQGSAGVVQKVWDAMEAINTKTNFFNSFSGVEYVFDVFGFSRGATEARLFVDLCCNRENRPSVLRKGIKKYNKKFSNKENSSQDKIQFPKQKDIKFNMGIYDTVASVGVIRNPQWAPPALSGPVTLVELLSKTASTFHDKNVNDLGLDTVANDSSVQKVVHICALDEYRENFALCALPNGGKVEQFFMPGIHTDIGGSELPGFRDKIAMPIRVMEKHIQPNVSIYQETPQYYFTHERLKIRKVAPLNETVEMTLENLKRLGWLKDETNKPKDIEKADDFIDDDSVDSVDVRRYSVGIYSNLPLAIMAEQHNVVFDDKRIKGKHSIPGKLPKSYGEMKALWKGCNSNYGRCYFPKSEEHYKDLRLRYLHFSSSAGIISGPINGPHYNKDYCYERILYTQNGEDSLKST